MANNYKDTRKTNKKEQRDLITKIHKQRVLIKIFTVLSILLGGMTPLIFFGTINPTAENPFSNNEIIIFSFLVLAAIVNITYGIIMYRWSMYKDDDWFINGTKRFGYNMPLQMLGGAFMLGALSMYLIWSLNKIKYSNSYENDKIDANN